MSQLTRVKLQLESCLLGRKLEIYGPKPLPFKRDLNRAVGKQAAPECSSEIIDGAGCLQD